MRLPVSTPRGILTSRRLPSTSTRRWSPWNASSSLISASASAWRQRRPGGRRRSGQPPAPPHAGRASSSSDVARRRPGACRGRGASPTLPAGAARRRPGEEHPEEVGEPPGIAARPELVAHVAAGLRPPEAGEARERVPGRTGARRPRPPAPARAYGLPVRAELVVELALLGVGQDRVGLVDVLEPLLGGLVARVPVRMVLARELAEGLLDVGLRRRSRAPPGSRSSPGTPSLTVLLCRFLSS